MHLQMQKESDLVHFYQMLAEQTDAQKLVIHDIKKHLYAISLLNKDLLILLNSRFLCVFARMTS